MKMFFTFLFSVLFSLSSYSQFDCNTAIELWCGEKISDNNIYSAYNTVTQGYCGSTYNGYTGKEKLYKFTITGGSQTVKIALTNLTADLDMFLLRSCSPADCIAKSDHSSSYNYEYISVTLDAGTYYIALDGWGGAGSSYQLELICNGNSGQLECIDAPEIQCGQTISSNTNTGVNNTDGLYCNAHGNYSGKEKVYELNLDVTSVVSIYATGLQADLDMFLLNACDRQTCVALSGNAGSNSEVISKTLEPGQYFIVLDGYQGVSSPFNLSVSCTSLNSTNCVDLVTSYYSGNGSDLKFNYKFNAQPNTQFISWNVNGATLTTAPHVQFIFPTAGTYNICAVYKNLTTGLTETCCRKACINIPTSCENLITYQYVNGVYQLTLATDMANVTNVSWRNDTDGVYIDPNNMAASCRTLTVSVRYFDTANNCWVLCCRTISFCPPSSCQDGIASSYDPQTNKYKFTFNHPNATNLIWKFDETGETLPNGQYTLPNGWTCNDRTATVYYYDTVLKTWKACCKKFNLCPPQNCEGTIDYDYIAEGNKFKFTLNVSGATNAEWKFEEDGTVLPNGLFSLPSNWTCKERTVKVTYYDPAIQVYRVCTKRFYICPPNACSDAITYTYDDAENAYTFDLNISGATNLYWRFDENNLYLPNGEFSVPLNWQCAEYTVSVFYYDSTTGCYRVCCKKVNICPPTSCDDNLPESSFTFEKFGSTIAFTNTSTNYDSLVWNYDGGMLNSQGDIYYTPGTYDVCLKAINDCGEHTYCSQIVIGDQGGNKLTFIINEIACRALGTEVLVPVTLRNFVDILTFNFTIQSTDSTDVKILGIEDINPLFNAGSNSVISADQVRFFWSSTEGQNLADDEVMFNIRISLINVTSEPVLLKFANAPVATEAFNGDLVKVMLDTDNGSVCVREVSSLVDISGKIIRPGNNAPISNVKVSLLGAESKEVSTNEDGNFILEGIAAGENYTLRPTKNLEPYNGLNALDIVALQRHILQITPLVSPYKLIAADVNNDRVVNALDVVIMQRMQLRIIEEFPFNTSWRFIPSSFIFKTAKPLTENYPEEKTYTGLDGDRLSENFYGIKIGDLNGSADATRYSGAGDTLTLSIDQVYVENDSQVEISVRVKGFDQISAIEGTISWEVEGLEFVEVRNFGIDNLDGENFGRPIGSTNQLTFNWTEAAVEGKSLEENAVFFTMVFNSIGVVGSEAKIKFENSPLDVFAADNNLETVFVQEESGTVAFIAPISVVPTVQDVLCKNGSDGQISISVSGATGNYTYLWGDSSTTTELNGLQEGYYAYTVTDVFSGSINMDSIEVKSPDQLVISITDISADSDSLATISVSTTGGVSPYVYSWDSVGLAGESPSGLENGVYGVTVTDDNGCEVRGSIDVNTEMTSSIIDVIIEGISVFPNPTIDRITVSLTEGIQDGNQYWSIYNTLGQKVLEGLLVKDELEFDINLHLQPAGIYYLKIKDHSLPILVVR